MLNYRTEGSGPPLLLIHGFGISFNIWNNMLPLLKDDCTLIMVELPGIGRSPAPEAGAAYLDAAIEGIEAVRLALGIDSWHVLSYSSGTRVGERYLARHHRHARSAIFLCPAVTAASKSNSLRAAKDFDARHPVLGNWILSGWRLWFLVLLLGFSLRPNRQVSAWAFEIGAQDVNILKDTIRSLPGHGSSPIAELDLPTLLIYGAHDLIVDPPRRPSPNRRIIRAAHSAPVTNPGEVAEAVLQFIHENNLPA